MAKVTIYTTQFCAFCVRAIKLSEQLGIPFEEIRLDENPDLRIELSEKHNWRTVPMIFVGDRFIGGYDDYSELHQSGKLIPMLESEG